MARDSIWRWSRAKKRRNEGGGRPRLYRAGVAEADVFGVGVWCCCLAGGSPAGSSCSVPRIVTGPHLPSADPPLLACPTHPSCHASCIDVSSVTCPNRLRPSMMLHQPTNQYAHNDRCWVPEHFTSCAGSGWHLLHTNQERTHYGVTKI